MAMIHFQSSSSVIGQRSFTSGTTAVLTRLKPTSTTTCSQRRWPVTNRVNAALLTTHTSNYARRVSCPTSKLVGLSVGVLEPFDGDTGAQRADEPSADPPGEAPPAATTDLEQEDVHRALLADDADRHGHLDPYAGAYL